MKQLQITEVPSLVLVTFHPVKENGMTTGFRAKTNPFQGPIKYHSMHSWMGNMISTLDKMSGGRFSGKKSHQSPEQAMAKLVPEVASGASLVEHCTSKGGICVLALIDVTVEKHAQVKKVRGLLTGCMHALHACNIVPFCLHIDSRYSRHPKRWPAFRILLDGWSQI